MNADHWKLRAYFFRALYELADDHQELVREAAGPVVFHEGDEGATDLRRSMRSIALSFLLHRLVVVMGRQKALELLLMLFDVAAAYAERTGGELPYDEEDRGRI